MSTFSPPNVFQNATTITASSHNDNWDDVTTFVNNLANGTGLDAGAITETKIANTAVSNAKLATNAVAATNIQTDAVTTAKIQDDAVTAAKIAAGAVGASELATDAVTTVKILDGNVTTAKVADSAITSAKIADGTIVNADISASAAIAQSKLAGIYTDGGSTNHTITISTASPTGGAAGDIWFKY